MATKKKPSEPFEPFKFVPAPFDEALLNLTVDALKTQLTLTSALSESLKPTWHNALEKAATNLRTVPSRLVDGRLVVASDSGNVYAANRDSCQCTAFLERGNELGCWHRAAFVIVDRYNQVNTVLNRPVI